MTSLSVFCYNTNKRTTEAHQTHQMTNPTNYETQNVAFHIKNSKFVFNTAKACVIYCDDTETPWTKFVRCMTHGQIGKMLVETPDGVRWDSPAIDATVINNLLLNL